MPQRFHKPKVLQRKRWPPQLSVHWGSGYLNVYLWNVHRTKWKRWHDNVHVGFSLGLEGLTVQLGPFLMHLFWWLKY